MDKKLFIRYIKNELTEKELNTFISELQSGDPGDDISTYLYRLWEDIADSNLKSDVQFESILNSIHYQINLFKFRKIEKQRSRKYTFIRRIRDFAAILLIPVLILAGYMYSKNPLLASHKTKFNQTFNEVYSSADAITKITLPDGSTIWLNHNSTLKYPAEFTGKTRSVQLTGEGYFDVVHNSKIPFIVETGGIKVLATGTTFNVMTYPDEEKIETTLIEGSIDLFKSDTDFEGLPLVRLIPGKVAIYDKSNNEVDTRTFSDQRYFSWIEGKLIFTAEPMDMVVKKLSKWFNVDIQIKDPELSELTLTATFIHETLPDVMELISLISPLEYKISNREINPDGSFTKRRVILTKKNITNPKGNLKI